MNAANFFFISGALFIVATSIVILLAVRNAPDEAMMLVAEERKRQVTAEGYSAEHDDEHDLGQLGAAAACYAMPPHCRTLSLNRCSGVSITGQLWPFCRTFWKPVPNDRVRELTKAGALILAELERELRARKDGAK